MKRSYDMATRQRAKDATREAIIGAAIEAFMAERSFAVTLPSVAERAGVTVKTVLRHFGSRDALIDAAWMQAYHDVIAERAAPHNDIPTALRVLIDHYERRGDMVLAVLSDEHDPRAVHTADTGRLAHRAWVDDVFAARLPDDDPARSRVIDVLVVATDVYCWKLLRRERGLSVDDVLDRMSLLTESVLTGVDRGENR
ncbi:TetR/AcrR family transcriptional regulator [Mycolicibacterium sp. 018/SC-01/001]|uniref:TetR/AcrR family transcriptional regulator n=1 Tax=Mycolicibacterium sp. 018/SC-01/001 TaxID=2592069 RepID=UPI00117FA78C|nr:TetR/AcrR family transcriptional regulator [Mycolicibacterium sp. 018/SC-01/001]TRW81784.1 TetR/AcrR family transcriptional regulator [Mycolicibacterium sp. 018/SC-01/001]